jgi:hypothetical protein
MDYEAIKAEIRGLIEEAKQTPHGRVETVLEPLREAMIEARREGVKLIKLYEKLTKQGVNISASSFAKYSQRHLQTNKSKGKGRSGFPGKAAESQSVKHEKVKAPEPIQSGGPTKARPRIASGNF